MPQEKKRGYKHYFSQGKIEVDEDTGCWIWLGAQYDDGYGKIRLPGGRKGIPVRAQAYFWYLYRGPAQGMDIAHQCHRRLCVNLRHLRAESRQENLSIMFHYPLDQIDQDKLISLWQEGFDYTVIADRLMAPRPAIMRLMQQIDLTQLNFTFEHP